MIHIQPWATIQCKAPVWTRLLFVVCFSRSVSTLLHERAFRSETPGVNGLSAVQSNSPLKASKAMIAF